MGQGKYGDNSERPGRRADNVDRLITETETAIRNTRSFLDHLRSSEHEAREVVDSMTKRLERNLEHLQRRSEAEHR